mmetsp:Transcript_5431/g.19110  ORF Transcript_5431/g.19110 Transcript_5431/m.19110 type:complete len:206 (-) Transcript_5431:907-1524(-)
MVFCLRGRVGYCSGGGEEQHRGDQKPLSGHRLYGPPIGQTSVMQNSSDARVEGRRDCGVSGEPVSLLVRSPSYQLNFCGYFIRSHLDDSFPLDLRSLLLRNLFSSSNLTIRFSTFFSRPARSSICCFNTEKFTCSDSSCSSSSAIDLRKDEVRDMLACCLLDPRTDLLDLRLSISSEGEEFSSQSYENDILEKSNLSSDSAAERF